MAGDPVGAQLQSIEGRVGLFPFIEGPMQKRLPKRMSNNPEGRPAKPVRERASLDLGTVEELAALGVQRTQLAKLLGISRRSLYNYLEDAEFLAHFRKGEARALQAVEVALFRRCVGYTAQEVTMSRGKKGQLQITKVVEKHVPPDPTCLIYYTHNRDPRRWPNRQQQDLSMNGRIIIKELDGIAPDELLELARQLSANIQSEDNQ